MAYTAALAPMDDDALESLAREISAYLSQHPDAADTADGILRWWLPRVRLDEAAGDLQRALDALVERGAIAQRRLPDGRVVYARVAGARGDAGTGSGP